MLRKLIIKTSLIKNIVDEIDKITEDEIGRAIMDETDKIVKVLITVSNMNLVDVAFYNQRRSGINPAIESAPD